MSEVMGDAQIRAIRQLVEDWRSRASTWGVENRKGKLLRHCAEELDAALGAVPPPQPLPDIEEVAARCHEAWMRRQEADGQLRAPSRITGEEQMRPYHELSETVKEYDRVLVRTVYEAIEAARGERGAVPPPPELYGVYWNDRLIVAYPRKMQADVAATGFSIEKNVEVRRVGGVGDPIRPQENSTYESRSPDGDGPQDEQEWQPKKGAVARTTTSEDAASESDVAEGLRVSEGACESKRQHVGAGSEPADSHSSSAGGDAVRIVPHQHEFKYQIANRALVCRCGFMVHEDQIYDDARLPRRAEPDKTKDRFGKPYDRVVDSDGSQH